MYSQNLSTFIAQCKKNGLNITAPRITIFKYLQTIKGHPSAEEIYKAIKRENPSISLATVYKTLELLAEYNVIKKVTPLHDLARYDANNEQHHHLVCIRCKQIEDIGAEKIYNIEIPPDTGHNFKILNYQVYINGLCEVCQKTP